MPRARKAQQPDDRQLAFTLAVESVPRIRPARTPAAKPAPAPKDDRPVPYVIRGVFRFSNGQELERSVGAVSPSPATLENATADLIARMRESGWHFAEGNALLVALCETTREEQPMQVITANAARKGEATR